ncbi:GTPase Era [Acetivibrio mesophilus]|uniref:GTPase Era n=1 Tax=Acetivibrio mesophilus TaxID=2487273 RepID=A0A4Q0I689_9FIRM|nr:GTPase Era [Acetivibrio mesophilus]ODM25094.1 GTPase Era [Clostridium sp. Bc-iso-3]RXE59903.1 GTPase Era [Acetivibrio mesophilus]HHV29678.1 GTPase Era [Clostridium sp.]
MAFKSGFVSIVGRPNVGKSTLLNKFTGEKIAIMSDKPQTTRNSIRAIDTGDDYQIIYIDTPGIHKPKTKLGDYMVNIAKDSLNEVDLVLFLVEVTDTEPGPGDLFIIEQLKKVRTPVFCLINKIDLVEKDLILPAISAYKELMDFSQIIPISALEDESVEIVKKEIKKILPEGPKYFPEDMITDQPEKVIAAELIREKILELLSDEVPHGVGVEVIMFRKREDKDILDIQANIYCEKGSHKGIVIGKSGKMLKSIGSLSRIEIERLFGTKVFLELWVKVKPDWRNNEFMLKMLGYNK